MNVIWRTLLTMMLARRRVRRGGALAATEVSRVRVRTLPTDLDLLRHMNNGRYLSLFDLGRWDLLIRTGLYDAMRAQGWYAVVSAATITYRKSLTLWQPFVVESRMIGRDDRAVYLEQRAVVRGEVYASAIIRSRILSRRGGTVSHEELAAAIDGADDLPVVPQWMLDWAAASALPSTRKPAPSTWD